MSRHPYEKRTPRALATNYDVSRARGFLPNPDPLQTLPSRWTPWDELAAAIPELLANGTLRSAVENMPLIIEVPKTARQRRLALVDLSFLGNAYVFATWETEPAKRIPSCLAIPWRRVTRSLGFQHPPILNYPAYVLWNWELVDPFQPMSVENLKPIRNFLGDPSENWFICVHVEDEMHAADAIVCLYFAQYEAYHKNWAKAEEYMPYVVSALEAMNATLKRMPEQCIPHCFFTRVRPWIHGYKHTVYEGVDEYCGEPQNAVGESGAQSSIIPSLDAVLGISHPPSDFTVFLDSMRPHMPPKHNQFINALGAMPPLVEMAKTGARPLLLEYVRQCIALVHEFRKTHRWLAKIYINDQTPTSPHNSNLVGTAGTNALPYLDVHVAETKQAEQYATRP